MGYETSTIAIIETDTRGRGGIIERNTEARERGLSSGLFFFSNIFIFCVTLGSQA